MNEHIDNEKKRRGGLKKRIAVSASAAVVAAAAAGAAFVLSRPREKIDYMSDYKYIDLSSGYEGLDVGEPDIIKNDYATINFTYASQTGGVIINYNGTSDTKLKVQIKKDGSVYTYDLNRDGSAEVFPLPLGDGDYQIQVCQQAGDTPKYSLALGADYNLVLSIPNAPFIWPNQYVNFTKDSLAVEKAAELTAGLTDDIDKARAVYNYIIKNVKYDAVKAKDVESGYLPTVDETLTTGKGICLDYAALLAAMLRSLSIPTKLVVGYVDIVGGKQGEKAYHAWNEFYINDVGWFKINDMKIEGGVFTRVDSTFDSSGNSSKEIMDYIGNGTNYDAMYYY